MTDTPAHIVNPSDILVGSLVRFTCPKCGFSFRHVWLVADGSAFGPSFCYMHGRTNVEMVIVAVDPPTEVPDE